MRGRDSKGSQGRPFSAAAPLRRSHPLAGKTIPKTKAAPNNADWELVPSHDEEAPEAATVSGKATPAPTQGALKPATPQSAAPKPAAAPKLDGEGKRYVTLAQFLKMIQVAPTGGAAKMLARSGDILVNGQPEDRPGRKLHQGDQVTIDGQVHPVTVR
jgi:ribosome-associated protein